ncbi:MAG: LytR family transcriptional regulator [Pseudonocardiales bacterium]|nr:MAG: LytR family transcriptional regulator [Pseudonocardiales bacterium]
MANEVWNIPPQAPRRPDGRSRLALGASIGFAALSFVILVGSGLAWVTFNNFTSNIPHGAAVPGLTGADADGKDQNILLIGNDSRAGATAAELRALSTANDGGSVNTDTMMVLHVPADGGRATIISFPRDSWVSVPGHGKGKINSAYGIAYSDAKGAGRSERRAQSDGIILMIKTINALTGLHIDHYMQVNLLGFYRISNAIGGVTVCLTAAQNPNTDSDQFGRGYSGINLPKGVSVIKGSQALAFVRQRHGLPRGDLDRVQRQQYFLGAAFRKVTTAGVLLNPFKLHDLLGAVGSSLLTDPKLDLLKLGRQFQEMSAGKITFKTIPNDGPQTIYPDGVETAIVQVDTAAMPGFIRQLQGKNADPGLAGAKAAAPSSVTADVLNGTKTVGLAGRNASQLRGLGFKVNTVGSTDASADTVIEYPSGQESEAKAVSGAVPGATLVQTSSVDRVTLVLGANNVQVKGLGAKPQPTPKRPAKTSVAAKTEGLGCIN